MRWLLFGNLILLLLLRCSAGIILNWRKNKVHTKLHPWSEWHLSSLVTLFPTFYICLHKQSVLPLQWKENYMVAWRYGFCFFMLKFKTTFCSLTVLVRKNNILFYHRQSKIKFISLWCHVTFSVWVTRFGSLIYFLHQN